MNFRENSKRSLQFFLKNVRKNTKKVQNLQHKFLDWKWPPRKVHLFWWHRLSLRRNANILDLTTHYHYQYIPLQYLPRHRDIKPNIKIANVQVDWKRQWQFGDDDVNINVDVVDDDIYIIMKCLCVSVSITKKTSLPTSELSAGGAKWAAC